MTRLLILGLGDTAIGLSLLAQSPQRTSGPAYTTIKSYAPLDVWGVIVLAIGVLLLLARQFHHDVPAHVAGRVVMVLGSVGASWTVVWSCALLVAISEAQPVSWTGPILWFFFGTVPHLALAFGREG